MPYALFCNDAKLSKAYDRQEDPARNKADAERDARMELPMVT